MPGFSRGELHSPDRLVQLLHAPPINTVAGSSPTAKVKASSNAHQDTPREQNEADGIIGAVPVEASNGSMRSPPRRLCLLGGLAASATLVPFANSSFAAAVDAKQQQSPPPPPPPKFDAFPDGLRLLKIRAGEGKSCCCLSRSATHVSRRVATGTLLLDGS